MDQIKNELFQSGVKLCNILYLNLDKRPYKSVRSSKKLENEIDKKIKKVDSDSTIYLFIDEIQNVKGFEATVNSYREEGNISIFITGSNSYLLSGKLVTKLTGRYVEFQINTLTYRESLELLKINKIEPSKNSFEDYLRWGGFPKRFVYSDSEARLAYLSSTIDEIISKDILKQKKIRNKALIRKCVDFITSNPALTVSSKSVVDYLLSEDNKTKASTVENYLRYIFDSKISDKVNRYDIKGKSTLKTFYKSYLSDTAFKTLASSIPATLDLGPLIENVVYHELICRGYSLSIGKLKEQEIDFIVRKAERIAYVQVCYLMGDKGSKTYNREMNPLLRIDDNYPKYIISMDPLGGNESGIRRLRLIDDFLLGNEFVV